MKKSDKFVKKFVNEQYRAIGVDKNAQYAFDNPEWYKEHKLTKEQMESLWMWGFKAYRKQFKTSKQDTLEQWNEVFQKYRFELEE